MSKILDKPKRTVKMVSDFLSEGVWKLDFTELSKLRARLVKHLKVILVTLKGFSKQKIGREAVALSYFGMMAAVPMVAVVLFVSNGFGLEQVLSEMLFKSFPTSTQLINAILRFANNILAYLDKGLFGWISFGTFIWLIIWLMLNIELAFNRIWHVQKSRNLMKRIAVYFTIMFLSPFLLLMFLYGWAYYGQFLNIVKSTLPIFNFLTGFLFWVIFYGLAVVIFSALYKFIPHAKVEYSAAIKASVVSGLAFVVVQYLYLETQMMVTKLNAVYGVIAALPLFMIWMTTCWNIILIGSELSFGFQHVDDFDFTTNDIKK